MIDDPPGADDAAEGSGSKADEQDKDISYS